MQKPSFQHFHCSTHPQSFLSFCGWNYISASIQWASRFTAMEKKNPLLLLKSMMLSFNTFKDFSELKPFLSHFSQGNVNTTVNICCVCFYEHFSGGWAFLGEQSPLLHTADMTRWRNITDNCLDVAKCVADKVDGNGWWEPVVLQRSWLMDVDQLLNSASKYLCPPQF